MSKRADRAFEYFLLIATILQSILFQLITFLLTANEQKWAIAFAAIFFFPYMFALITWIYATIENLSRRTILLKLIAWGSVESGITVNLMIFFTFLAFKPLEINLYLGIGTLIVGILSLQLFTKPSDKILKMYEDSTPHYEIWKPRFGRRYFSDASITHFLTYICVSGFLLLILKIWTD